MKEFFVIQVTLDKDYLRFGRGGSMISLLIPGIILLFI